ncbi:MAG TPA: hypothetical protein VFB38_13290 [Chthonomonadaceae bacterium]|nr:hypothetical protein [Chthonomonadaceae bacterium]
MPHALPFTQMCYLFGMGALLLGLALDLFSLLLWLIRKPIQRRAGYVPSGLPFVALPFYLGFSLFWCLRGLCLPGILIFTVLIGFHAAVQGLLLLERAKFSNRQGD